MNREDFPMCKEDLIYFDNGATTLKPKIMIDSLWEYYSKYTANAHRGDYHNSLIVDQKYEGSRKAVKDFIGAKESEEIIFTLNATDSLNRIVFGFFKRILTKDDEVLITKSEHASNVLPWYELADEIGFQVKYIELTADYQVTLENVKQAMNSHTKVISLAHVTNVVGDVRPIKEIATLAHQHGIYMVVDGAQAVPHMKVNVQDLDIDFMVFSAHKMCGPTGVGVLYGKKDLLNQMRPTVFGGGMNAMFFSNGFREYMNIPYRFEAGTPNIGGVIAFGDTIRYLEKIGMERISEYEKELCIYAKERLKEVPNLILYNEHSQTAIITFNIKDIFSQDLAIYLDRYNICVRAGNHCAKILIDEIGIKNTCRMSLYFYNTKEEIDRVVEVLKNPQLKEEIITVV